MQVPPQAERNITPLRRVFWLTLMPLFVLLVASFGLILVMVGRVNHHVECMGVETGEIAQARSLADELRGIESWIVAAPGLAPAAREAADADARQHLETAAAILHSFGPRDEDPSDEEHQQGEDQLLAMIRTEIELLRQLLGNAQSGLEDADPHVRAATRAAVSLSTMIDEESRQLGATLVQSSQEFVQIVLVITGVALLTFVIAAALFTRRVVRPLTELREAVRRIGEGRLDLQLSVRRDDELGLLAQTLQTMTDRIRRQQEDLEDRVAQRTNELLRTARLADLGTLAAGVAHEINNPLAAIATCAEGLMRDEQRNNSSSEPNRNGSRAVAGERSRLKEYLEIIAKEAMRVRDTTARLLAFARPESGRREPVWLLREIKEVTTMLDHSATRAGVELVCQLSGDAPPVLGDPADLRQVAFNLIKNALDASPRGGKIWIRLFLRDDRVVLEVEDQGSGVQPELRERIFEPFVTTKEPGAGTGLGLAISHRIVTHHAGSLRLLSPKAGGACFSMELPRLR